MFDDNNSNELDLDEFRLMIKTISSKFNKDLVVQFFNALDKS